MFIDVKAIDLYEMEEDDVSTVVHHVVGLILFVCFIVLLLVCSIPMLFGSRKEIELEKRKGRVCLVTGGTRGIGLDVCKELLRRGDIVILIARSKTQIIDIFDVLKPIYRNRLEGYAMDLNDLHKIPYLIHRILKDHRQIDVLVNNAAVGLRDNDESSKYISRVNIMAPKILIDHVLPSMKCSNYGRIINVTNICATTQSLKPYAHSKFSLNKLTRKFTHAYFKDSNIQVNGICVSARTESNPQCEYSTIYAAQDIVYLTLLPDEGPSGEILNGTYMISSSHSKIKNWTVKRLYDSYSFIWL